MKVGIMTGGFDPVTPAHIDYFRDAKRWHEITIVFVNSDAWLTRKKGKPFMPQKDRVEILRAIKYIDLVVPFMDRDDSDGTANESLYMTRSWHPTDDLYFLNGGDRGEGNVPEEKIAKSLSIHCLYGVGGFDKTHSSSWYLQNWNQS